MGLSQRIIAKILIEDGIAVKYKRFTEGRRIVGDPVSLVGILNDQQIDEFFFCFLGKYDLPLLVAMAERAFCPVTVAGGIADLDAVKLAFRHGADKVVIKGHKLAEESALKYGAQSIVFPIDYVGEFNRIDVPDFYGEIILTSVDRDGMGTGFDISAGLTPYSQPVVVAGGCGKLSHAKDAINAGAHGVCISSMFAFTDKSPIKLRSWLLSEGCNVRKC